MSKFSLPIYAVLAAATTILVSSSVAALESEGQATYSLEVTSKRPDLMSHPQGSLFHDVLILARSSERFTCDTRRKIDAAFEA
jgi:hypothetical protein